jgi:ribonuclease HII
MKMLDIVGIDEVGRGPIAGPVAVCSFRCKPDFFESLNIKTPLRDSKKLSKKQREEWFVYLKKAKGEGVCDYSVSFVSAESIDKFGIVPAIKKALKVSLEKVASTPDEVFVYLDGGLEAPDEFTNQETTIKGDELYPVISCASIIAKVSRDTIMTIHAKEYPDYGFEKHVGYGTKAHYEAIKTHGVTPLHRKSFLTSYNS